MENTQNNLPHYSGLPPYFSSYSMTRSGMDKDPQQGHNVFITGNWERPNYSCGCSFIKAGFHSRDHASELADELNNELLPILNDIIDVYHRHYSDSKMGDTRVIVRRDTDGDLGWSFNQSKHIKGEKLGEWITRGDTVMLADGKTEATLLFVFDDSDLEKNLKNLGRH